MPAVAQPHIVRCETLHNAATWGKVSSSGAVSGMVLFCMGHRLPVAPGVDTGLNDSRHTITHSFGRQPNRWDFPAPDGGNVLVTRKRLNSCKPFKRIGNAFNR